MLRFALLCTLCFTSLRAAEPTEIIRLWPSTPPGPDREVGEEANVTKPEDRLIAGQRIIKLANVATPEAHVFQPDKNRRNGSAIIICPGGGYHILAWDLEGTEVAEWCNSIGVTAIVLKYRVPTNTVDPRWLLPVQDAQRTLSLVRSRAKEWGLAPDRIGILGFSAGGDTAARAALATKRHYESVDDTDQASCRPDAAMLIYPGYLANKENTALAADLVVTKDAPPMFLVHAFNDRVPMESSLFMSLALKKSGVPAELHVFDTGGHGYGLRPVEGHPVTNWPQLCEVWLGRNGWLK
ncbi:MAG: alpha/beta hydrolase [Fuerstiella sp.]